MLKILTHSFLLQNSLFFGYEVIVFYLGTHSLDGNPCFSLWFHAKKNNTDKLNLSGQIVRRLVMRWLLVGYERPDKRSGQIQFVRVFFFLLGDYKSAGTPSYGVRLLKNHDVWSTDFWGGDIRKKRCLVYKLRNLTKISDYFTCLFVKICYICKCF